MPGGIDLNKFESDWLTLREPLDRVARNKSILEAVKSWLAHIENPRILDLACGTGSTVRAFSELEDKPIAWCLVDNDAALLEKARLMNPCGNMRFELIDISKSLEIIDEFKPDLVVTSAFLDLVSVDWLQSLVSRLKRTRTPFYGALTYDGRVELLPELQDDDNVIVALNKHQTTDKGFGSALGPGAAQAAKELLKSSGYEVLTGSSDWQLRPAHERLARELFSGWCHAASGLFPERSAQFSDWLEKRLELLDGLSENETIAVIGHQDIFAYPS